MSAIPLTLYRQVKTDDHLDELEDDAPESAGPTHRAGSVSRVVRLAGAVALVGLLASTYGLSTLREKRHSHLRDLCANTTWSPGLWMHCGFGCGKADKAVCGGLSNARNRIQTCLRLAIDAGSGIILPHMLPRNQDSLWDMTGEEVALVPTCSAEYLDIPRLEATMASLCPQMPLRTCGNWTGIDRVYTMKDRGTSDYRREVGDFRGEMEGFLREHELEASLASPVILKWGDPLVGWNYSANQEHTTIQADLFDALTFNKDLLALGATIRNQIDDTHGYVGIHLRAEDDWPQERGNATLQTDFYLSQLSWLKLDPRFKTTTIYVSCGDRAGIETFRVRAKALGFTVDDKWSLLKDQPDVLSTVDALEFDMKAIVEYRVLVEADYFFGHSQSTFSMLVALGGRKMDLNTEGILGRLQGIERVYEQSPSLAGDRTTKLLMVDGFDLLDSFP